MDWNIPKSNNLLTILFNQDKLSLLVRVELIIMIANEWLQTLQSFKIVISEKGLCINLHTPFLRGGDPL